MADDLGTKGLENQVKGIAKQVEGRVRDAAADLTGDTSENLKGKLKRIEGEAQEKIGREQTRADQNLRDDV